jgi:hypothetical protein
MVRTTLDQFRIGAGAGAFACDLSRADRPEGHIMPLIEARTRLAADQMTPLQELEVVPKASPAIALRTSIRYITPIIRHRSERARR